MLLSALVERSMSPVCSFVFQINIHKLNYLGLRFLNIFILPSAVNRVKYCLSITYGASIRRMGQLCKVVDLAGGGSVTPLAQNIV